VRFKLAAGLTAGCILVAGCGTTHASPPPFTFLGQIEVPHGYLFNYTTVGGLSGISYDAGRQVYYVISDDRSAKNPARFNTLRIPHLDNMEGITLGPKLSDGRQSVVLVTDDNFNARQVTQFYAFAM
jgi:hypothetical protein